MKYYYQNTSFDVSINTNFAGSEGWELISNYAYLQISSATVINVLYDHDPKEKR